MIFCNNRWRKFCCATVLGTLIMVIPTPVHAQVDAIGSWVMSKNMERLRKRSGSKPRASSKTHRRQPPKSKPAQPKSVERYPQVRVNGRLLSRSGAAVEINGNTFVAFREIAEALGATVRYDSQKRLITARTQSQMMEFTLPGGDADSMKGQRMSYVSGTKPFMRRGILMVPLRLVAEKMGAQVTYAQHPRSPLISIVGKQR